MEWWPRQRAFLPFYWRSIDGCPLLLMFLSLFQLPELAPRLCTPQITGGCFALGMNPCRWRRAGGSWAPLPSPLSLCLLLCPEMGVISNTLDVLYPSCDLSGHFWNHPFGTSLNYMWCMRWSSQNSSVLLWKEQSQSDEEGTVVVRRQNHPWSSWKKRNTDCRQVSTKCVPGMNTPPATDASCPGPWLTTPAAPHPSQLWAQWPLLRLRGPDNPMLPLVGGCSGGEVREHTSYLKSQLREVQVFDVQLCSSLCIPMDYSPSGSSVHGILQARILIKGKLLFLEHLPWDRPRISKLLGNQT